jgi:hypothetical protein
MRRWSSAGRPLAGFCGGSNGASLAHSASVSSWRLMPELTGFSDPSAGFAHRP